MLTGLPNRLIYQESLKAAVNRAKRTNQFMALLYLDLDRFKEINDRFGHDIGDALLISVAERMTQLMRSDDMLSSLGGDEFAIILNGLTSKIAAADVAMRIINAINGEFTIQNYTINISISIGIAICPTDGTDLVDLNRKADIALYNAKNAGRNNFQYYSNSLSQKPYLE